MATRTALVQVAGQIEQLQAADALAGAVAMTAASGGISTGTASFANSNGVSFGINGQTVTASVNPLAGGGIALSAGSQIATSGTAVLANSNGVTFGMSGSSQVTASVAAIKTISAGTTNIVGPGMSFADSNGLTFGANGSTITASYTQSTAPGALAAGTQTATTGTMVFANSNAISFGANGATITAKLPSISFWENPKVALVANAVTPSSNAVNLSLQRISVPFQISATRLDLLGALTVAGSTAGSFTLSAALYTFASSTLSTVSSSSIGVTFNSGTNSTAASIYGAHSGTRWRSMPTGTWNVTPGEYMLGVMVSINGPAGTTGSMTAYGGSSVSVLQDVGVTNALSAYFADGVFSAGTARFPPAFISLRSCRAAVGRFVNPTSG